nr:nucleoporin nsp1 [Quercus suber]
MSHSLTDMIDEINRASTQLSSNNPTSKSSASRGDDPLTQIVRVLNGHLAQLQTIDAGAATLQGKVTAAQHDARSLGQSQDDMVGIGSWFAQSRSCAWPGGKGMTCPADAGAD